MKERHIFCRSERLAYTAICDTATRYGAQVFPHLRIKEVANRDWINPEHFDYALKGHIDFTVAMDFRPILAIELDGRYHQAPQSKERDTRKDGICDALEIPLVRIDYGYLRPELLKDILMELVQTWLEPAHSVNHGPHELVIQASAEQLEAAHYKFGQRPQSRSIPTPEFKVVTNSCPGRYFECSVSLLLGDREYGLGKGRARTPEGSPMCGFLLAERIAVAQASNCIRTAGGAFPDAPVQTKLILPITCSRQVADKKAAYSNEGIQPFSIVQAVAR